MKKHILLSLIGIAATLLSACANTSINAQRSIMLHYRSSSELNPNLFGQASPLLLTVYQLKNISTFNQEDYFALQNSSETILESNLLEKESYLIIPGENKNFSITINTQTQYLAFVAGYSEINTATWRLTIPVEQKTSEINLKLDKYALSTGESL